MAFDRSKFLAKFVIEAKEHVNKLNEGFILLEKNPDDSETLNALFRSAHTIKGSAKMMKLPALSEVAHKLEDVMDALRQKKIQMSKELSYVFFEGVDKIDCMLDNIASGREDSEIPEAICSKLEKAANGKIEEHKHLPDIETSHPPEHACDELTPEVKPAPLDPPSIPEVPKDLSQKEQIQPSPALSPAAEYKQPKPPDTIRISSDKLDELIKLMGEIVSSHSKSKQRILEILEVEKLSKQALELMGSLEKDWISNEQKEDILYHARSLHLSLRQLSLRMKEDLNIQSLLSADLQDRSLKMRMLPLSTIFETFHRTVRELSRASGKDIDFIIEGAETELDKKIIEKIGDPLMHMIRNCIEHGIEKPEDRKIAGKPETGTIKLSARYEGGNVLIEISDDGAGISLQKIKEKAIKKNIFEETEIDDILETELINLIFLPGFSTSDIITDLSGRGVGMDVVKKNIIEDLKGSIQIQTRETKGTSFHIRLPLTIAIVHVLFITSSDMTFAVPTNYIDEIISVSETDVISVIGKKAIRLREEIVPIVRLNDILNFPVKNQHENLQQKEMLILITSMGNEKMGVIIDSLIDEEDMVIKSLPEHIKNIPFISGCIISGKNEIFNVLHIPRIMESAKESTAKEIKKIKPEQDKKRIHILVVDDSVSTREIEKGILESYGYKVSLAGDGMEGFEMTKNTNFDLIVSDVEMPRMDGFSLTEKLRADEAYKNIPVILITTRDKEEDKKRGIMVGADAYIIKGSFEQDALLETVQNLVG